MYFFHCLISLLYKHTHTKFPRKMHLLSKRCVCMYVCVCVYNKIIRQWKEYIWVLVIHMNHHDHKKCGIAWPTEWHIQLCFGDVHESSWSQDVWNCLADWMTYQLLKKVFVARALCNWVDGVGSEWWIRTLCVFLPRKKKMWLSADPLKHVYYESLGEGSAHYKDAKK
jgi:hypothetical protein